MGCKRSEVQILSPRPAQGWTGVIRACCSSRSAATTAAGTATQTGGVITAVTVGWGTALDGWRDRRRGNSRTRGRRRGRPRARARRAPALDIKTEENPNVVVHYLEIVSND